MAACTIVEKLTVDVQMGSLGVENEVAVSKERPRPQEKQTTALASGQWRCNLRKALERHPKRFVTLVKTLQLLLIQKSQLLTKNTTTARD